MSSGDWQERLKRNAMFSAGELLRQAREQVGVTQQELAERLDITQPSVSQAETSGDDISVTVLRRNAAALGCELRMFIVRELAP